MRTSAEILADTRTIAVVGLSNAPSKASYEVAAYLKQFYSVVGVNPKYQEVLGFPCYASLADIPIPIDLVDVFQRSENVQPFVQPAIDMGAKVFWMQLGIQNPLARSQLEAAGVEVIENQCTKVVHAAAGLRR